MPSRRTIFRPAATMLAAATLPGHAAESHIAGATAIAEVFQRRTKAHGRCDRVRPGVDGKGNRSGGGFRGGRADSYRHVSQR